MASKVPWGLMVCSPSGYWGFCVYQHVAPCDSWLDAMNALLPGTFSNTHKLLALRALSGSPQICSSSDVGLGANLLLCHTKMVET